MEVRIQAFPENAAFNDYHAPNNDNHQNYDRVEDEGLFNNDLDAVIDQNNDGEIIEENKAVGGNNDNAVEYKIRR